MAVDGLLKAQKALKQRQYLEAFDLALACVGHAPSAQRARLVASQALCALERLDEALQWVEEALQADEGVAALWHQKALILRQQRRRRAAAEACLEALLRDPNHRPAFGMLRSLLADDTLSFGNLPSRLESIPQTETNALFRLSLLAQVQRTMGNLQSSTELTAQASHRRAAARVGSSRLPQGPDAAFRLGFIIIGAQKAGTTSLHGYIGQHPKVLLPSKKEIHYFSLHHECGLPWYRAHFPPLPEGYVTGEASPSYFWAPGVDDMIRSEMDSPMLFLLLRHPVDRFISAYHHGRRLSGVQRSLDDFTSQQIMRKRAPDFDPQHDKSSIGVSTYPPKLRRWMSKFGPDRLQILIAEDLFSDPARVMPGVFTQLGLRPVGGTYKAANAGAYAREDAAARALLMSVFRDEIDEVEQLIGRPTGWVR